MMFSFVNASKPINRHFFLNPGCFTPGVAGLRKTACPFQRSFLFPLGVVQIGTVSVPQTNTFTLFVYSLYSVTPMRRQGARAFAIFFRSPLGINVLGAQLKSLANASESGTYLWKAHTTNCSSFSFRVWKNVKLSPHKNSPPISREFFR